MGVIDAQRASSIDIPIAGTAQKTMGDPSIIIACVALAASGLAAGAVAFRKLRGSRVNPTNELPVTDPPAPRPVSSVVAPSPREQVEMPTPKPFLGMPTASIETLPIQIYCPTQATENAEGHRDEAGCRVFFGTGCVVCMTDFEDGCELRRLPCGHCFHPQCVDRWLKKQALCPVCRRSSLPAWSNKGVLAEENL